MSPQKNANDFSPSDYQHLAAGGITEILNFSPMPTIVRDKKDRIVFWNYAAERTFGYALAEARGLVWFDLLRTIFPREHTLVREDFEREGVWKGELVSQSKDGHVIVTKSHWMKLSGKRATPSDLIIQMDMDITHQKYDREVLRSLDLAFRATNMVNWVWDFSTNKINWFGDTKPIFGRDSAAIDTYEKWEKHILPEDIPLLRDAVAYYTHTKSVYEQEFRCQWPDGSIHWIMGRGRVYYLPSGAPSSMLGMNFEITERKRAEQRLQEARAAAEEASKAKSVFITNMSHEMRTPLTSIIGYAQLLQEEELPRDEVANIGGIIRRNGEALLELVNNVLNLAMIQTHHIIIKKRATNLNALMHDVLETVKPLAKSKDLELNYQAEEGIPSEIHTDPDRLRQILLNLINNAIKFTDQGFIRILAKMVDKQTGILGFFIQDTGRGVSERKRKKIFEAFEQEEEELARSYGGAGLGLSISSNLARLLGGDVELVHSNSRGSTFLVTVATR